MSAPPPSRPRQASSETRSSRAKRTGPGLRPIRLSRANCSISRKSASSPPGPDSTAPCRSRRMASASARVPKFAGDLFDGGADGGAGRREEGAEFGRVDGALAAGAAGGHDPARPQQGADEAGDLVERLSGNLADEVGEGAEQGADDEAEQHPGELLDRAVDEHRVDGGRPCRPGAGRRPSVRRSRWGGVHGRPLRRAAARRPGRRAPGGRPGGRASRGPRRRA